MRALNHSFAVVLLMSAGTAFAAGGGSMPSPNSNSLPARAAPTPEEQARTAYNAGVRAVEKADALQADAARQSDPRRQQKLSDKARTGYSTALKKFSTATELVPGNHEAWNYVGYTSRKLGNYQAALAAYDKALSLKPDYAPAIEYRGQAYLGLNRLAEAKDAYLALYAGNRQLAAQLLAAMQEWIGAHRADERAGVDGAAVEAFASWVSERSAIAQQTAGLTREGARAAW